MLSNQTPIVALPSSSSFICALRTEIFPFARPRSHHGCEFLLLPAAFNGPGIAPNQALISLHTVHCSTQSFFQARLIDLHFSAALRHEVAFEVPTTIRILCRTNIAFALLPNMI